MREGYHIFTASHNEIGGWEKVAHSLQSQINEAEKEFDIEFLSNAKIDADSGGAGRELYFGYQCTVLKRKK